MAFTGDFSELWADMADVEGGGSGQDEGEGGSEEGRVRGGGEGRRSGQQGARCGLC